MIVECEKLNSSFCKVMCEEYDIILDINAWFSVFTDGYQFSPSYKMHLWDGKTKFFNLKNQILPIGLKGSLKKFCEKNGYEYKESGFLIKECMILTENHIIELMTFSKQGVSDTQFLKFVNSLKKI